MEFYAHSTDRKDCSDWQGLRAHLLGVAERASANAAPFGGQELGWIAGALHDLGKYTRRFQDRLRGEVPRVDHATWGARIAQQRYKGLGTLMAYAIAGHHAGLANGTLGEARSCLRERLSEDYLLRELPPLLPEWEHELELPQRLALPTRFSSVSTRPAFQFSLLARMVFSCLVDADFVDTDNFYRRIEGRDPRPERTGPSLDVLRAKLDAHLVSLPRQGGINPLRADILKHVRAQATHKPGLFSLTVPTGGGKTLASLAFALDHAIAHGLRRVIYVVPFTSIIEQTAAVFRSAFSELGEDAVLEHHSAFFDDPKSELQSKEKRHLAMENWDAPIIVTTAVQFFESLFADRPARCRKLHNIAASVVILDEAQTLPLHLLRPCMQALDELALNYRVSMMLCTATQPALGKADGFKDGLEGVRELAPDPPGLYRRLKRVSVQHAGPLDDAALAGHLRSREQILCIVNNRRHARALFDAIADLPGACHLTTLMYARHRSQVLQDLRTRLKAGQPCRLVSTSLIEAGVDVSFPAVLRAEAGLDSIAQAAGRCNRNMEWAVEDSQVLVFESPDWAPPKELKLFAEAFRMIERRHRADLLSLEAVTDYFRELYWRRDGQLGEMLLQLFDGATVDDLPLETLAARFRMIEANMRPVIVPYDPQTGAEDPFVASALRDLEDAPGTARKLQPFLVQVPRQGYDALWNAGAIQPVAPERYGEQFVRLVNPRLYHPKFGLHWDDNPQFLAAEALVG
ncbi:MAG TPA: CRISPR-associated endonuclease Cas3'' [Pseudomonas sp.]